MDAKLPEIDSLMISSLILESFWEPSWLTYYLLVAPVTKIADMFDTFFKHAKMTRLALTGGGKGTKVGGRSGASGGRGRLRLRALKGFVSQVQHARLPLDGVRRIYVAFGEHPAAGSSLFTFESKCMQD